MRGEAVKSGRALAAGAAFFLLVSACAPPPKTVANLSSPTPLPSPTPTAPLAAAAPAFHVGEVGIAYGAVALTATGGVAPYKYAVVSGALPGGLTVGADGTIAGTPTAGGDFAFRISIADSGDSTTTVDGKISIADALTAHLRPECASYCNVELGCTTACGSFGSLTGGVGPFSFSLVGGQLPAGTSLNGLALGGTFKGQTGWLQFTVQAADSLGATTTVAPKFWMYPHVSLAGKATCYGNYGTGCTAQLAIGGGVPGSGVSVALVSVAPNPNPPSINQGTCWPATPPSPPPSSLSASGGYVNVTIPPRLSSGYGAIWTVVVTSTDLCGPSQYCSSNQGTVTIGVQCG